MALEANAVREFRKRAAHCDADAALGRLLEDAAHEIGFRYFALTFSHNLEQSAPALLGLNNYPEQWSADMISTRRFAKDPALHASRRANCGFGWDNLQDYLVLRTEHLEILGEAARAGLRKGFTVPANVPFEPSGACSFATSSSRKLTAGQLEAAELIGGHALQAARRLRNFPSPAPRELKLSPREIEVIRWVAQGKSNGDIALILGLSLETVKTYVGSILAKLEAVDRTTAAVMAARWGII